MSHSNKLSMKTKLIILCIGSVMICSTSLILIVSHLSEKSLRTQIVSNLQGLSALQSNEIQESFRKLNLDIQNFSDSKFIQDALVSYESVAYGTGLDLDSDSDISSSSYFKTIENKYSDTFKDELSTLPLISFGIALKNGFIVSQTGETNFLGKNLFKGSLKNEVVSQCLQSTTDEVSSFSGLVKENDGWKIYICQKILSRYDRDGYQKKSHMGYLVTSVDWNYFAKLSKIKDGLGETGQLFLVDKNKVVTPPRHLASADLKSLMSQNFQFQTTENKYSVQKGFENEDILFVNKDIPLSKNITWTLVAAISTDEALASVKDLKVWSYSISVLGLLLVSLVSWFFINSLSQQFLKSGNGVHSTSDLIHQVCDQLTQISRSVATSTQQQSAALDETSASMEEMNAMLEKTLEMSKLSSEKSNQCSTQAEEGESKMKTLVESVNEVSQSISTSFLQVKDSSLTSLTEVLNAFNNIETKTKVINEIAFQTKLLSFNASVEAARAGEHGKGFSVVATEVGNLANSVNSSATEINTFLEQTRSKISSLIKNSESLIEQATTSSNRIINKSREHAAEGMEFFQSLTKLISDINSESHEVSNAAFEQSKGVTEINKAILEISQSNTNNVNMVTDLEKQTTQLNQSSESLKSASEEMLSILTGHKTNHLTEEPKSFEAVENSFLYATLEEEKTKQPLDHHQEAA